GTASGGIGFKLGAIAPCSPTVHRNRQVQSMAYTAQRIGTLLAISLVTRPPRAVRARLTEDIAMLKSIGAVGERPRGRRWLAAARGFCLRLSSVLPANGAAGGNAA